MVSSCKARLPSANVQPTGSFLVFRVCFLYGYISVSSSGRTADVHGIGKPPSSSFGPDMMQHCTDVTAFSQRRLIGGLVIVGQALSVLVFINYWYLTLASAELKSGSDSSSKVAGFRGSGERIPVDLYRRHGNLTELLTTHGVGWMAGKNYVFESQTQDRLQSSLTSVLLSSFHGTVLAFDWTYLAIIWKSRVHHRIVSVMRASNTAETPPCTAFTASGSTRASSSTVLARPAQHFPPDAPFAIVE